LEVGDVLIAKVDDPSALVDWVLIQGNQMIQSLESVLSVGNTSGANDIVMADTQTVQLGSNANQYIGNVDANTVELSVQRTLVVPIKSAGDNERWEFNDCCITGDSDLFQIVIDYQMGTILWQDKSSGFVALIELNDPITASRTWAMPDASGTVALTSQLPVSASTTAQGIIEIATAIETDGGTDNTRAISPFGLANSTLASNVATNNAKVSNVDTNLSIGVKTATTLDVNSSDGTNATIPSLTTTDAGLAPASGGGTTNFLRADGTWANPASGAGFLTTTVSPAQITANQNDYTFTGIAPKAFVRVSSNANREITGIDAAGFSDRDIITFVNIGTNDIKFKENDALSTAANRMLLRSDFNMQADESITFIYDAVSSRWRVQSGFKN